MSIKEKIKRDLEKTAQKLGLSPDQIQVERTRDEKLGNYSTNMALRAGALMGRRLLQEPKQTGGKTWQSTLEIARYITDSFSKPSYVEKIKVAPPGFINFFLAKGFLQDQIRQIVEEKEDFVKSDLGKERKARVEFISANPTGPLHIGNARGGPLGDSIANILAAAGYKVIREYLNNDVGSQVEKFGQSISAQIQGKRNQNEEYQGPYVLEIAQKIGPQETGSDTAKKAVGLIFDEIMADLVDMGIKYDKIYNESEFVLRGKTKNAIFELKKKKVLKEKEGALWFAPSDEFLGDRESVVVRSNGTYTYFANDIAYHEEKFASGADLVVDILGSGHHGHVPRLKAAVSALGFDPQKLQIILYQFVRVKKGKKVIRMSKRAGNYVTAREVLDAVGRDAFRFFLLMHDPGTHMDFDLDLAKKESQENPVYYVQYAHARIASILRRASQKSKVSAKGGSASGGKSQTLSLLTHPEELKLIKKLIQLPELVEDIARNFQVHQLATYAISLADTFHRFYEEVRVISPDRELTAARLQLVAAAGIILKTTLGLMGISAPEKM